MPSQDYFKVGDIVLFGRWKNKKGLVTKLYLDARGVPMVEIEPIPKGRKKNKTFSLFKIWPTPGLTPESTTVMSSRVAAKYLQAAKETGLTTRVLNAHFRNVYALEVGKTFENDSWRIHRYNNSVVLTELVNAGKRGKKVQEISMYNIMDSSMSNVMDSMVDELVMLARRGETYARMLQACKEHEEVGTSLDTNSLRGVDVMPGGFQTLTINGKGVEVRVGFKDFSVQNVADTDNLQTCIPAIRGGMKAIPIFYRWVRDNEAKVKTMTYAQVIKEMDELDIPYHSYCAMD